MEDGDNLKSTGQLFNGPEDFTVLLLRRPITEKHPYNMEGYG